MSFRINYGYIPPLQEIGQKQKNNPKVSKNENSFQDILKQQVRKSSEGIKISSHANRRLVERNIHLTNRDLKALSEAMDRVDQKGAKESLMLYKDIAFIASIKNRTLITAMDPQNSKESIFTNIDSAIIVK